MQLNLKTIHKPATLAEATSILQQPGTYPLYGGAALQRSNNPDVTAGVDLSQLKLGFVRDTQNSLRMGSMLTLEQVRQACAERADEYPKVGGLAQLLAAEMPAAQRNTYTLGDLMMTRNVNSPTLTALLALGGIVKRIDLEMRFTMTAWLMMRQDFSRWLLGQVRVTRGSRPQCAVVYEKVARTPGDDPIVGAVAYVKMLDERHYQSRLALCGIAPTQLPQPRVTRHWDEYEDLDAALDQLELDPPDDHLGSTEYRTEMARVISKRALENALEQAKAVQA